MSFIVNTAPLRKGMRVVIRHKHARDLTDRAGGPIEGVVRHLAGVIVEERRITGRQEFRIRFDEPHPTGQEWFWRGLIYPEGSAR